MHTRFILIAAAAAMSASAFAAEPSKPAPQAPVQPESPAPKVVLASAETVRTPAAAGQQAQAPKRRFVRVTSCRCGDQQAQPDE